MAHTSPELLTAFMIDQLWCDIFGIYIRGWAHAHKHPVRRLVFTSAGETSTVETFHSRLDLLNFYPEFAHVAETGFEAYLPFPPFHPLQMTVVTDAGAASIDITVHMDLPGAPREVFYAAMRERSGKVLEIGARVVGDMTANTAVGLGPECQFIGFDIHPAPGVDIVGDAHELSRYVGCEAVDGVISESVLEHILAPWLVAAEINRVLRPGGLTLHIVPQTWPIHEHPNDFWRMSDDGLRVLFGPALGFEVITSGMSGPFRVIPSPSHRKGSWLTMPTVPGYGCAYILARKVAEIPPGSVHWPLTVETIAERSKAYPRH
jgi:SAM-dependent methyltransferase